MPEEVRHALFVSANNQYLSYLNALLNSIEKRKLCDRLPIDVVALEDGTITDEYKEACEAFEFEVGFVTIDE